jgi:hypothetical protein
MIKLTRVDEFSRNSYSSSIPIPMKKGEYSIIEEDGG